MSVEINRQDAEKALLAYMCSREGRQQMAEAGVNLDLVSASEFFQSLDTFIKAQGTQDMLSCIAIAHNEEQEKEG